MQTINQIIFSIFALILICIYLATIKKENHSDYRFLNSYWTNSILYKATAFGAWALSPALGKTLLLLANFSFYISALFLILFFRSWRVSVAKELVPYAYFLALIASGFFLSLLLLDNSYIIRLNFSIGIITILTTLAAYEVWNLLKDTKSLLLKLIFIFLSLQISMSMVDIYIINTQKISEVKSILDLDVEASMYLWITFSFHLIIYVMINSFLYEQLWLSEKNTYRELLNKKVELASESEQKQKIHLLLIEREKLIRELIKANRTITSGALTASIAHEISQPLAAIQINAELLKDILNQKTNTPEIERSLITEIIKSNQRAGNTIKLIKKLFKQEPSTAERCNIKQLLSTAIELAKPEIDRQVIKILITGNQDINIEINSNEILQVIINLLNNSLQALSYSDQDKKIIVIDLSRDSESVTIRFSDNGPGLNPDSEKMLFQFLSPTSKPGSMGLGLWLCQYIIEKHRGKIWYQKSPYGGAQFNIVIYTKIDIPATTNQHHDNAGHV